MKSWLAYIGAYACACLVWYVCVFMAFTMSRGGYSLDAAGLFIFVWLLPMACAFLAFAFSYRLFSGRTYSATAWTIGGAAIIAVAFVSLILARLDSIPLIFGSIGFFVGSFIVGRILTERGARTPPDEGGPE